MTFRRYSEWFLWNGTVLALWLALVIEKPIIWPMLILLLPLQGVGNVIVSIFKKRSPVMFWTLLCVMAAGMCWLVAVHYRSWFLDVLSAIPLGRALVGTWSARSKLLSEA
jgi:hypothetical protein